MNDEHHTDETDTDDRPAADPRPEPTVAEHPLRRAHAFFQKAVPALREMGDALDGGALDQVRETVVGRATELVQRVDEAVANATAIEGDVIDRVAADPPAAAPAKRSNAGFASTGPTNDVSSHHRAAATARWTAIGVVAAATTYGALKLQRRR